MAPVLHIDDVMKMLREMPTAFAEGKRSVRVAVSFNSDHENRSYHFSKLNLFKLINNNHCAVEAACNLNRHVQSLEDLPAVFQVQFLSRCIFMPICGFQVSDFPLWKLGDLLDETRLEEDVINALAELLYYQRAVLITCPVSPTHLHLPTSFLIDARYLYHQIPRVYSPELMAFRQRLNPLLILLDFLPCRTITILPDKFLPTLPHDDTTRYSWQIMINFLPTFPHREYV